MRTGCPEGSVQPVRVPGVNDRSHCASSPRTVGNPRRPGPLRAAVSGLACRSPVGEGNVHEPVPARLWSISWLVPGYRDGRVVVRLVSPGMSRPWGCLARTLRFDKPFTAQWHRRRAWPASATDPNVSPVAGFRDSRTSSPAAGPTDRQSAVDSRRTTRLPQAHVPPCCSRGPLARARRAGKPSTACLRVWRGESGTIH